MKFFVNLKPSPWKVGNAAHFINVERRLRQQVGFLRGLRDQKTIEAGPYAILNAIAPSPAFIINADSWEGLSRILHEDPMMIYQGPDIHYLADWEESMAKHADTIGSDRARVSLEEDVRIDTGMNLPRAREALEEIVRDQSREIQLLRTEVGDLLRRVAELGGKK